MGTVHATRHVFQDHDRLDLRMDVIIPFFMFTQQYVENEKIYVLLAASRNLYKHAYIYLDVFMRQT